MDKELPADALSADEEAAFASMREEATEPPQEAPAGETPPQEGADEPAADEGGKDEGTPEEGGDRRNRMVDYRALREAREELAREREQRAAMEARFNERLQVIAQHLQGQQQQADQPADEPLEPFDPDKHDVFDYLKRLSQENAELRNWRQETLAERQSREQREAQAMQVRGFRQQLSAHEAEFAKRNPDYFDRINAYVDWKAKELAAVEGYDERALPSLRQHFQADLFRRAYTLANRGVDPADHFYRALAGWAPQKSPAEEGADQPAQPAKPAAEDKFTSLKGGSGAGDARAPRSATDLLKMSDDEFAKAVENGTFKKVAAR